MVSSAQPRGALEREHRRPTHELLQPLRLWVGHGLGLPPRRGHRHGCSRPGIPSPGYPFHFDPTLPALHVGYDSTYGTIISDWKQSEPRFTITIPADTTATITLTHKTETIGSGTHSYTIEERCKCENFCAFCQCQARPVCGTANRPNGPEPEHRQGQSARRSELTNSFQTHQWNAAGGRSTIAQSGIV